MAITPTPRPVGRIIRPSVHWQMLMLMLMPMHVHHKYLHRALHQSPRVRDGRMSKQPKAQRDAVKSAGLPVAGTCGGVGLYALLVGMAHVPPLTAGIVAAAVVCVVVASIAVPRYIDAQHRKRVAEERERQRTYLIVAGIAGSPNAESLLRLQPYNSEVIVDPRYGDDLLRPQLPAQRTPSEAVSGAPPGGCGGEPPRVGPLPQPRANREPPRKKHAGGGKRSQPSPDK